MTAVRTASARSLFTFASPSTVASAGTSASLAVAIVGGFSLAILFASARWIELSLFPYAVILQVTPIVAIAPLIIVYVDNLTIALLICAWIVAFFPILSNTTIGLNSADHNLLDLMRLYGAKRWQVLWFIRIPGALPFFLGGLRISGGLALIGAAAAAPLARDIMAETLRRDPANRTEPVGAKMADSRS